MFLLFHRDKCDNLIAIWIAVIIAVNRFPKSVIQSILQRQQIESTISVSQRPISLTVIQTWKYNFESEEKRRNMINDKVADEQVNLRRACL